ncbi:UDP-Glc:alpha-D-GlcNAc-diphosphoundecaprenol beta-1,3-glucosyltransferase WfgD [Flavobacteriales bacterium]|jgi:glycosyltransferase involved in cell wall biosynthesis|nr:hypothetical protein [Flavobacteriales bacterium]MCL4816926.1 glycosyltransferase family 2 protein [Flavobacteriales bacterium]WKZ75984.1 MAG: glycosyltransferase family A protein [Vicingaceae bacterium]GIK70424.1 MAG: hypothetical protein BroJett020_17190 [Bacteroidota bacterium]CAG0981295.1 UDP-Glc:alpha-D-GlcNAc-diphosphoundecaprenol beta-1,3-glucosyltransferase WfgD [Flavobacteriales bacterium]
MPDLFFSVIIPTYNRASFITNTIRSILSQTYTNFEVIVVDDGSTDNTEDVVKSIKDERVKYYKRTNAERGAARNFGTQQAKGDYLNFFDSDDIAYPEHLQTALELITQNLTPEIVVLNYDITNTNIQKIRKSPTFNNINKQLIFGNVLSCNGVFLRKDVALENPFSEVRELSASEDYLLWLQLAAMFNIYFSNTKTSAIIEHNNRSVLTMNIDRLIKRKQIFIKELFDKKVTMEAYRNYEHIILSQLNSYISLHAALLKNNRKLSFYYLSKSIVSYPQSIFSRRFLAIIKHLIIN